MPLTERHALDVVDHLRAATYGLAVFTLSLVGCLLAFGRISASGFLVCLGAGAATAAMGSLVGSLAGSFWTTVFVKGAGSPSVPDYSYEQSLVVRGEIDAACAAFEAIIAASPRAVPPRILAAELYWTHKRDAVRAAQLLREVQRIPGVNAGDDIQASNRLVDLLIGPLSDPSRALVELRRLIERYPGTSAAVHASRALAQMKGSTAPTGQ
jgi:hypothetical protein